MTPKTQKVIKTGHKPLMTFGLPVFTVRKRKPTVHLRGNLFAALEPDSMSLDDMKVILTTLKRQVERELDLRREREFCVLDVLALLETPLVERGKDGKKQKNPDGSFKSIERPIKERRKFNRIRDAIETAWDVIEEFHDDDDDTPIEEHPITITLKVDDAVFLCTEMIRFYEEATSSSFHIVEGYDLFTGLKKEATEKWDNYETGKDEEPEELSESKGKKKK